MAWSDFQITLGSDDLFQPSVLSDTKIFYENMFRGDALFGGLEKTQCSGLVSKALYDKFYSGFMVVDLQRYTSVNEFMSIKNLRVRARNASLGPVSVDLYLYQENGVTIDVNTGKIVA